MVTNCVNIETLKKYPNLDLACVGCEQFNTVSCEAWKKPPLRNENHDCYKQIIG